VIIGVGRYIAGLLETEKANIQINGAGQAEVWVMNVLDATLNGAGVILCELPLG